MTRKSTKLDLRALIRERGLRATPARLAVCDVLSKASGPLTHAEVSKLLASRDIDQTTVFRNLTDLAEVNLIRRIEVGDHVYRFEWQGGVEHDTSHAHFVCVECGEVTEVLYKGHCSSCE